MELKEILFINYGISYDFQDICDGVEQKISNRFAEVDRIRDANQLKVLVALQKARLSDRHFNGTTGYGYDDIGRDIIDEIYSSVFGTEDALVRSQIVSGTQALAVCLFGILRPGDELLAATGKPYDTLEEVIGIRPGKGSLKDFGVTYKQVDLLPDGNPNLKEIVNSINDKTKMVALQRSRGYSYRKALCISDLEKVIQAVKSVRKDIIIMVDNCYGEFVEHNEPTNVGADLVVGSLIKNPGGGLAQSGGYIAGSAELIELCANRLTSPGLGKHVGASLGNNRNIIQGFYLAPHVVSESLKGAIFTAALFEHLGFETSPSWQEQRTDIIQAIKFNDKENMLSFCRSVQAAAPVDSFVTPEPWDMPGYENPVIMAAGAFIQGASIELSADGPVIPPYIAYLQGGLVYANVKLAAMLGAYKILY